MPHAHTHSAPQEPLDHSGVLGSPGPNPRSRYAAAPSFGLSVGSHLVLWGTSLWDVRCVRGGRRGARRCALRRHNARGISR